RNPRTDLYFALAVCGVLLLAVGVVYGQTLNHAFLDYDDALFVQKNPHVAVGLTPDGFSWAFTDGPGGEWYPLAMLSHMLDAQVFGLNAWGHHLTNVLLHAATSVALFLVWWRYTSELWPSAFVAALFAVHPQHVEAVAWIAERKEVLSAFFFVLALGAYLGYVRHSRGVGRYLLLAILFALGLLAKPMIVTLPPLLLLLDFWPLDCFGAAADAPRAAGSMDRPGVGWLLLEKTPLLGLAVADCLMTLSTHAAGGVHIAWPARLGGALVAAVTYVVQFFCPVDLAAFYPLPEGGPPPWKAALAAVILLLASAAAVAWRRRLPYVFVGWFWYLGMLCPVLGVVKIGRLAMADRYTYLPSIGLSIALAWCAVRLLRGLRAAPWVLGISAGIVTTMFLVLATRQAALWRDDETLWRHALQCTRDNGEAEVGLADALRRRGAVEEAAAHYRRAIQFATDFAPFNNFGLLLAGQDKGPEAIAMFRRAVEIQPDAVNARINLGLALAVGGQFDESHLQFRRALEIDPRSVDAHRGLAYLLSREAKTIAALAELEQAVKLDPNHAAARNDLGLMLAKQGQIEAAMPHFQAAVASDPKFVPARINLAQALAARGQASAALDQYRQVLEIDPGNRAARAALKSAGLKLPRP
ncbi:MAG TPA: tetratricopeptide repeat protein, partial [Pirellulales bacterium]|nr:tetratricopeptide repeat protein [Pirellulales bacterium]